MTECFVIGAFGHSGIDSAFGLRNSDFTVHFRGAVVGADAACVVGFVAGDPFPTGGV
jgi:hypothetical protein